MNFRGIKRDRLGYLTMQAKFYALKNNKAQKQFYAFFMPKLYNCSLVFITFALPK